MFYSTTELAEPSKCDLYNTMDVTSPEMESIWYRGRYLKVGHCSDKNKKLLLLCLTFAS